MPTAKQLPSGSWRCQVYSHSELLYDENGLPVFDKEGRQKKKRIYESFTSSDTTKRGKREAEHMADEYALTKKQRPPVPATLLCNAITDYCKLKSNVLSPSTIREYKRMGNSYFAAINCPLSDITPDIVQRWVNVLSLNHKPKTVKNAYGLLTAVLDTYAPEIKLNITLPQKVITSLYVPSDSDIKALLDYFRENDKDMELAVYLAAFGTLRRSEICALTADDINGNIVSVNKAMVDKGNSQWVIKTTKTTSSTRLVEMPDYVIEKFPKSGNIININPDQITHRMAAALKKLKMKSFRFHDLRHYAASIMHAIGVPDQYIMQRGGWNSDRTLKAIYRGTIEEYTKKYTDITIGHFDKIQHELQHKK